MEKLNTGNNNKKLANLIKTSKSLKNVSNLKKLSYTNRKEKRRETELVNKLINDILESCKPNEKRIFNRRLDSMSNLDRKNLLKIYDNYLSDSSKNYNNNYKKHNNAIKECKRRIRLTEKMVPLSEH